MQFSVEVRRLRQGAVLVCRGRLEQGKASDYLFDLVTRPERKDVILDATDLTVEKSGLPVLALCSEFLQGSHRRLLLQNVTEALVQDLRAAHGICLPFTSVKCPAVASATHGSVL